MSNGVYVIGIDIGTQGTKAGLFNSSGICIAEAFEQSKLIHPSSGVVEQDPEAVFGSVLRTIKEVMLKTQVSPKAVYAVSIAAQMAGIMGIDHDWNAVTPYDSWLDTRCSSYIDRMKAAAEQEIIQSTGGQITYAHGPKILWWKHERPGIYKKISKFVTLGAYVSGRLCDLKGDGAFFDYTYLHFTGFSDIRNNRWNRALLNEFGVEEERLGKIIAPFEAVGKISSKWTAHCGLAAGTIVAAGCGDSAASSLGAGITTPGIVYDVAGTASIFSASTEIYAPDIENKTLFYAKSVLEGLWIPLAYINGGGLCIRWFKDLLKQQKECSFGELDRLADRVAPGSEGLYFIPHFAGRACPNDPDLKGTWIGLGLNHTQAHLYRSILEAIGYEYYLYNDILSKNTACKPSVMYGVGGGSKSKTFNGIKADILGMSYVPLKCGDTGLWGSALIAGRAAGIYANQEEVAKAAAAHIEKGVGLSFNKENHIHYALYAQRYAKLLKGASQLYKLQYTEG